MKKLFLTFFLVMLLFVSTAASASAVVNDTVKIGLRYGADALFSANLENAVGEGYDFGWFDSEREFVSVGGTEETTISMTLGGTIYVDSSGAYSAKMPGGNYRCLGPWHMEMNEYYEEFEEAAEAADALGGWPVWDGETYAVHCGAYDSQARTETAMAESGLDGTAVCTDRTSVYVLATGTDRILFEGKFDAAFGVLPLQNDEQDPVTWFKGYRYPGGFEYIPYNGNLQVINVLNIEDYVKGVIPFEMSGNWPLAALEAQAICARTYACKTRHTTSGFDICNTTHCQVYYGRGSGTRTPSETSDTAVDATAGEMLFYGGKLVDTAVYHAHDGGATEDAANVWGTAIPYLKGKADPYEAQIKIPSYSFSVTYTAGELTNILQQKGYDIGTVKNAYVSQFTENGNVRKITFDGSKGTKTVAGETCRTIFYSSTYNKSVRSMRFTINGGSAPSSFYINSAATKIASLDGITVLSGSGTKSTLSGGKYSVLSASGKRSVDSGSIPKASDGLFLIEGTGSGHNVGMSQYGAKAMAELGYDSHDILSFYYTDISVE